MDAGGTSLAARQARLGLANSGSLAYNKAFEPIARPLASRRLNSVFGAQISFFQFCTLPSSKAVAIAPTSRQCHNSVPRNPRTVRVLV
jgi:hypothetical protein